MIKIRRSSLRIFELEAPQVPLQTKACSPSNAATETVLCHGAGPDVGNAGAAKAERTVGAKAQPRAS